MTKHTIQEAMEMARNRDTTEIEFRAYLTAMLEEARQEAVTSLDSNTWKSAIDHELAVAHLGTTDTYPDARVALQKVIDWHCMVHGDPAVSSAAQALVERGRQEAAEKVDAFGEGDIMAIAAVRYCLGRMTYIVGMCADWLIEVWPALQESARTIIQRDIEDEFTRDDVARRESQSYLPLGADCDRKQWERVRKLWACRHCGGNMKPGQAMAQTYNTSDEGTCSPGGPGKVVECLKCEACGWSVT